jgi:ribose 5-phosphate isomerase B
MKTVAIGSDHRGVGLKNFLVKSLEQKGYKILDFGTFSPKSCDYPVYCSKVAFSVVKRKADQGIFICKTGIGSCMALNKVKGVRAALVHNIKGAKFSRFHNDANILVLGADFVKKEYSKRLVITWLKSDFQGGRHVRRVKQMQRLEEGYEL